MAQADVAPQPASEPAEPAQPVPAAARLEPASESDVPAETPMDEPEPAEQPRLAPAHAADLWQSAADEGWLAAGALATPANNGFTSAGLPRRRRGAHLVPGAAGQPAQPVPVGPRRSRTAEDVRGRLSSYQQGLRQGRDARRHAAHDDEPETDHAAQSGTNAANSEEAT
jgi:hypothetical protein